MSASIKDTTEQSGLTNRDPTTSGQKLSSRDSTPALCRHWCQCTWWDGFLIGETPCPRAAQVSIASLHLEKHPEVLLCSVTAQLLQDSLDCIKALLALSSDCGFQLANGGGKPSECCWMSPIRFCLSLTQYPGGRSTMWEWTEHLLKQRSNATIGTDSSGGRTPRGHLVSQKMLEFPFPIQDLKMCTRLPRSPASCRINSPRSCVSSALPSCAHTFLWTHLPTPL
jgi:hypothetical protein